MNKDKAKALGEVVNKINKTYGAGTIMTAADAVKAGKLTKKVLRTPSLELNEALWCGGLSGIVELFGPTGSGKTSLAIDTIVLNQKEDPDFIAAWLETEGSVTETILQDHGVDLDRLIYIRQEDVGNAESALDILRGVINRENLFNMIVINSVAGLTPKKESEDDLDKQNIALIARTMSKFFRVATGDISKNNITAVFINQVRDNVGQMFGDTAVTTGGKALGFYADQRIRMNQLKIQAADPIKEEEGVKISFIIKKNRRAGVHNPFTKGQYYARFDSGIDSVIPLPQMLLEAGIMEQKGAWWYYKHQNGNVLSVDNIEGKFPSKNAFVDILRTNKQWYDTMTAALNAKGLNKPEIQTIFEVEESQAENALNESLVMESDEEVSVDINDILDGQ